MRPTLLESRLFWGGWLGALALDLLTKRFWGVPTTVAPVWRGVVLLLLLLWLLGRLRRASLSVDLEIGVALLAAGVAGNAVDVLAGGAIRDWLPFFVWRTNLADVYVWIGLLIWVWRIKKPSPGGPARV